MSVLGARMETGGKALRRSDRLAAHFLDLVASGGLKAGEKLSSEENLCRQFEVSRAVVRDAMQQLKAKGVVETRNGSGTYVSVSGLEPLANSLSLYSSRTEGVEDWLELLDLRSLVEVGCVRKLAEHGSPESLARVWEALEVMRRSRSELDLFSRADIDFHRAIVKGAGNRLLTSIFESLSPMARRFALKTYHSREQVEGMLGDHERIFEAIRQGDGSGAAELMGAHLEGSRLNLIEMAALGKEEAVT